MFDIGFFELVLVGVVALLVIGPERLPETLRTLALWWGRLKRALQSTRAELEQQLGADDVRRQLHNEEIMRRLNASKDDISRTVNENVQDIQSHLNLSATDPGARTAADSDAPAATEAASPATGTPDNPVKPGQP